MAVLTKITSRTLADNAVTSAKIADGAIAVADVADGSISTAKLADDAVTQAKIGAGAVGNTEVNASAAIANSKLADDPLSGTNAKALGAGATFSTEQQELHGSTFTASGTGATVTGDLKLKSLVDKEVIISGAGTITGSGGRVIGEGVGENESVPKSGGGFTGPIQAPYINTGRASIGNAEVTDITVLNSLTATIASSTTFPAGHVIQVASDYSGATVTSAQTQRVFEGDSHDLNMTNVTKGNKIHAIISGGMINAETTVCQYKTGIRFVEHNPTQHIPYDYWTTTHVGGNFNPDLYHPGPCVQATHVVQFTGNMSIKRGTWTSDINTNCVWTGESPNSHNYGPVRYFAMEIQQ